MSIFDEEGGALIEYLTTKESKKISSYQHYLKIQKIREAKDESKQKAIGKV